MSAAVKVLVVFVDETDMWANLPLYEAIIKKLAKHKITGATAIEGMMGYGALPRAWGPVLQAGTVP